MKTKRNILACLGCVLVLLLGVTMICGGCKADEPEWNHTGVVVPSGSDDGSVTTPTTKPAGPDTDPSVSIGLDDRENFDGTESTAGATSGGTTDPTSGGTTGPTTAPTTPPDPTEPSYDEDGKMTYESYIALSGQEQMAYMRTFPSLTAFNNWYNAAKAEYEAARPKETIGPDGNINLNP